MKVQNLNIDLENLFILDVFFKKHFKGSYRYGTMGFFYWKLVKNRTLSGCIKGIFIDSVLTSTASITPKTLLLKNKEITIAEIGDTYVIAEIGDTYVMKKFSGRGFFLRLI